MASTSTVKAAKPRFDFDPSNPQAIIESNLAFASDFERQKHKKQAARNWDIFYKSHPNAGDGLAFFKDRHWTSREFEVLGRLRRRGEEEEALAAAAAASEGKGKQREVLEDAVVLEAGCGTGAFVYPLLDESPSTRFYAFDFSKRAVDQVKEHPKFDSSKVCAFVHDLTHPDGSPSLLKELALAPPDFRQSPSTSTRPPPLPDIVSCIFVLSALSPTTQTAAVKELFSVLKPGGTLLLRDYAIHDQTQLRFHALPSKGWASVPSLLSPPLSAPGITADDGESGLPWYRRGDGTMCYFFSVEGIDALIKASADEGWLMEGTAELIERPMENRKEGWGCTRRFVQGSWVKTKKT